MRVIKNLKIYLFISIVFVLVSLISLIVFGLNLSIDFTGGTVIEYKIAIAPDEATNKVNSIFNDNGISVKNIEVTNDILEITSQEIDSQKADSLLLQLNSTNVSYEQLSYQSIGSLLGLESLRKSIYALLLAFLGILFYIAFTFKKVPNQYSSFKFGAAALVAMAHDVLITFGIFSILGRFANVEVDILFVTALLTVIGYSVNDTIVVFDRIRENLIEHKKKRDLAELIEQSVNQTMRRSIGTSVTVLIILICLFVLGGDSIKYFVLTMIVGVVVGTYSSIFFASPLIYLWHKK